MIELEKKRKKTGQQNVEEVSKKAFQKFVLEQNHPCVMAQTVFTMDQVDLHVYENFGSKNTAAKILKDLKLYLKEYDFESNDFRTFLAVFKDQKDFTEEQFEKLLWKQLEFLHEVDDAPWDKRVSEDPEDKNFSFSLGGRAFYMVGLH
ncbi:MAG: guanitoxin biosynthesis heme-dependent pre-guanitoxin N-hydroxylase GntA, partial [Gillisia sp.]